MSLLQNSNAIETATSAFTINNSIRLDGGTSKAAGAGYLTCSNTNGLTNTYTISMWVKRGSLTAGSKQCLVGVTANGTTYHAFDSDLLSLRKGASTTNTTAVFRDPSAWYHIVLTVNSGVGQVYVNNVNVSSPAINNVFTSGGALMLGANGGTSGDPFDGYMAEVHFVDGQALTPSSFGEVNSTTGAWQAKQYTGTWGANGSYLKFSDIATTSGSNSGLGKDFSGNGNYWNTTNISVTSGTGYDAMIDSPTLSTSGTRPVGNYAIINSINPISTTTISEGNLTVTSTNSTDKYIGNFGMSSGKWYWEAVCTSAAGGGKFDMSLYNTAASASHTMAVSIVYGFRFDADAGTFDRTSDGTTWTAVATGLTSGPYFVYMFATGASTSKVGSCNFGQRPFTYTPPTGFKALCTSNLPDSTIVQGNKYMDATTYTGNGTSTVVTNVGGFKPDFLWIKSRSNAFDHVNLDTTRGKNLRLSTDTTQADTTQTTNLNSFNSNGFTTGSGGDTNTNAATFVAWQWNANNGTTSSNTSGSITSTVQANTTAGFSVVTYTGTGSNATVGHGLGVAPKMVIVKDRTNGTNDWPFYHTSAGPLNILYLNSSGGYITAGAAGVWNSTAPASTVFSIGTNGRINTNGNNYVAYCFAEIEGYSKFGSYTGNGSADGSFVYTGFRPKFLMIKRTDATAGDWTMIDTSRNTTNIANARLVANINTAEAATSIGDILSNGFKIRVTNGHSNASGTTYIYVAFAENPFKNSLAR